ncbi:MAG: CcoQ/FixQ family Cbb3-type cytochrome c oxidase assembly chaperone [Nitrospiraceae bacterium]|jgi:cbb3-type cytochrome oxidase subunit 3|nr:MAG: CcoQ/FixQ family Cbb3-type cytochrome c oxidase assembly chaperone [Nitrospiraceae bacterium]
MNDQAAAYFIFGLTLVVIFIVIIFFYYSKKRHTKVEEPKFRMFDDDE